MEFDVFGRRIVVERTAAGWSAFHPYEDGKRREVRGLVVPAHLAEEQIARSLADLFHESSSPEHPDVRRIR